MKIFEKLINKKIEYFIFFLLVLGVLWLKEINYLFYETWESPDFEEYFIYIQHFFDNSQTSKEHGLLYYYLHALNYEFFYSDSSNIYLSIHKSVQQVNFYIFLFGLLGYYILFRHFNFSKLSIYLSFIFINFFPPSISMRIVFKPEILAFALMPWIIYFIEKYSEDRKLKYLFLCIPFLVSAITIKGNVLVILSLYLFLSYFVLIFKIKFKNILFIIFLFLSATLAITLENNSANGKTILDIQSGSTIRDNYNYKASKSIIYKTDLYKLVSSPIKHTHADSFIAITLLETTGDYFDLYWDNDGTNYFKNRKQYFEFIQSNEIASPNFNSENLTFTIYQQKNTEIYLYESLGLVISIYLFYLLIKNCFQDKKYKKFLLGSFLGMIILLFHSITGIPVNNFDPLVGDTFKPLYYSFILIFSFAFLIIILFESKKIRITSLFVYVFLIIFMLGFPKYLDYDLQVNLVQKIENSAYCQIEKNIYLKNSDFENINCNNKIRDNNESEYSKLFQNDLNHKPFNLGLLVINLLVCFYVLFNRRTYKTA